MIERNGDVPCTSRSGLRAWRAAGMGLLLAVGAQGAAAQPAAPTGPAVLPQDTVVAARGGVELTMQELDARLAQMPAGVRAGYMDDPERIEMLLLNMLLEKQLAQMGRDAGLHQRRLFDVQAQQVVDRLLGSQAIEHHVATLPRPDFEQLAEERYATDKTKYRKPERLDLTQILVTTGVRSAEDARARAEEAHRKAVSGEVPFEELVREYNDGNPVSGRLQEIVPGQTVQPFEEAVFALAEPGDISPVIETRFGFHVVRLDRRIEESRVPFSAVKDQLVKELREKWQASESAALRERLNSLPVEAEPEVIASLRTRYQPEHSPLKDYPDPAAARE